MCRTRPPDSPTPIVTKACSVPFTAWLASGSGRATAWAGGRLPRVPVRIGISLRRRWRRLSRRKRLPFSPQRGLIICLDGFDSPEAATATVLSPHPKARSERRVHGKGLGQAERGNGSDLLHPESQRSSEAPSKGHHCRGVGTGASPLACYRRVYPRMVQRPHAPLCKRRGRAISPHSAGYFLCLI